LRGEGDNKIGRAVELIARLHDQSGRIPIAGLLKAFLDQTHYRAALLKAGYARPARNVTKLLNDASSSGLVSVREFLDYVAGLQAGAAREGEARATAGDVIRVMSVHAAKGLEFPVVVIGDVNYGRIGGGGLLLDPELGVHPPLDDGQGRRAGLYRLLQEREADQEAAEAERLLYVAATRAQEKLILNGCIKLTRKGSPGWLNGWLKELAEPLDLTSLAVEGYDEAGDRAHNFELKMGQTPVACTIYEPNFLVGQVSPLPEAEPSMLGEWSPELLDAVRPRQQTLDERTKLRERDPPRRVWRVIPTGRRPLAPAWIIGSLVHEALRSWRFPGLDFDDWARARAQELGLLDDQRLVDAVRKTDLLLRRFQGHPLYAEMAASERRLHEVPYTLMDEEGRLEQGIVDAIYLRDGLWTVVDFKTDQVKDVADFALLAEERGYREQLQRYGSAVTRLTGQQPRTILCMLNYAGRVYLEPDITNPTIE
jgi:ATP-dependent helicase/nuclease subunit A